MNKFDWVDKHVDEVIAKYTFPGHKGRPGQEGGSAPRDEGGATSIVDAGRQRILDAESKLNWQAHVDKHVPLVTEALKETISDIWNTASREKQIGVRFPERDSELMADLENKVRSYLTEAYKPGGDRSLRADTDFEFNASVLSPFLTKAFNTAFPTMKYSGFGPKSITMRIKNMANIPFETAMFHARREWDDMRERMRMK